MSQTTPDIRQLSTCCGKPLEWKDLRLRSFWLAVCSCGARSWADRSKEPIRAPRRTEWPLLDRIATLEAENAELLATLANERGEGEAPCEGWRYIPSLGDWQSPIGVVRRISWLRLPDGASKACWGWERWEVDGGRTDGVCDTARAAMRAASSQGADVPKGE